MYCVNCRSELNKNTDISNHVNSIHVTQTLLGLQRVFKLHMGFEIAEALEVKSPITAKTNFKKDLLLFEALPL